MSNSNSIDTNTMRSLVEAANGIDRISEAEMRLKPTLTKPAFKGDTNLSEISFVFRLHNIKVNEVYKGGNYIIIEFENEYGYKRSTVAFTFTDGGWTVDHRLKSPPSGHKEFLGWLDQAERYKTAVEAVLAKRLKGTTITDWV